jgi:hypothetical protein
MWLFEYKGIAGSAFAQIMPSLPKRLPSVGKILCDLRVSYVPLIYLGMRRWTAEISRASLAAGCQKHSDGC